MSSPGSDPASERSSSQAHLGCAACRPPRTSSSCSPSSGMLAVAFVHPSGRAEALVGVVCAAATLATGLLDLRRGARLAHRAGPGGRLPGHDPGGLRGVCPGRRLHRRRPTGRALERRQAGPPVHRRLRARGRRHRRAQPGRDRRPADPGRARGGPGTLGAHRARHLRLPADGQLGLAAAAGLQPDQPARASRTSTSPSPASRSGWRRCSRSCSSWSTSVCGCSSVAS